MVWPNVVKPDFLYKRYDWIDLAYCLEKSFMVNDDILDGFIERLRSVENATEIEGGFFYFIILTTTLSTLPRYLYNHNYVFQSPNQRNLNIVLFPPIWRILIHVPGSIWVRLSDWNEKMTFILIKTKSFKKRCNSVPKKLV